MVDLDDPRLARPPWRGRTNVDALTIACIEHAERIVAEEHPNIAHEFYVTQGSYQGDSGDPDSGTTHRLGGGVDLRWCGHNECYKALRRAGMFIWRRYPWQGDWPDHFHGAPIGHPHMDYRLKAQETSYLGGGDGLGGRDDGPRPNPIPRPVWPPEGDTVTPDQINEIVSQTVAALTPVIEKAVAANKLDVGRPNKLSDDKVLESVLNRLVSIDKKLGK